MSARCVGSSRSARMPPCTFGCRVTTRWPSIAGHAGDVGHVGHRAGRPSAMAVGGAAAGDQLDAELVQRPGQLDDAGLVVDGQQGSHRTAPHVWHGSRSDARSCDVEPALDRLDALVQRLVGVVGQDGHRLLGEDRPGVDLLGGHVHRAARSPSRRSASASSHRVPAGERRQQRRMGVEDAPGEARRRPAWPRMVPKPGHDDQVDARRLERVDDPLGVGHPVERRRRSSVRSTTTARRRRARSATSSAAQRRSTTTRSTGRPSVEDRVEDGPAARGEHGDAHGRNATSRRRVPSGPAPVRRTSPASGAPSTGGRWPSSSRGSASCRRCTRRHRSRASGRR